MLANLQGKNIPKDFFYFMIQQKIPLAGYGAR
jgi:hypothetical protein